MTDKKPGQQDGQGTWVHTEEPPKNIGEPQSVRDKCDAELRATGGRHR